MILILSVASLVIASLSMVMTVLLWKKVRKVRVEFTIEQAFRARIEEELKRIDGHVDTALKQQLKSTSQVLRQLELLRGDIDLSRKERRIATPQPFPKRDDVQTVPERERATRAAIIPPFTGPIPPKKP